MMPRVSWVQQHWLCYMSKWLLILVSLGLCSACTSTPEEVHETRFMMGTLVSFMVVGVEKEQAEAAIHAAADEMQRVEDAFTIYGAVDNDVKRFNRSPVHQAMHLNDEVDALLRLSLRIQQQSHGAFNPALGALNKLWGFSQTPPPIQPPKKQTLEQTRQGLNDCIHRNKDGWWRDSERCQLDFGGIAKGYAIDRGMEVLKGKGVSNALIDAGGDLRLIGQHGKQAWHIGIRHPRDSKKILGMISLKGDVSVVTSGDYERFFVYQGQRFHHLLNPQTAYPSMLNQSVTVVAKQAVFADAWSTAIFVGGKDVMHMAEQHGLQVLRVDKDGHIFKSEGLPLLVQ